MRNYVLGIIVNNKDLISIVISIIAVMIAYCSWKESKIIRIESGQAFLSISLIQMISFSSDTPTHDLWRNLS